MPWRVRDGIGANVFMYVQHSDAVFARARARVCVRVSMSVCASVYVSSESKQAVGGKLEFVPVERFGDKDIRTHICEVGAASVVLPYRIY